MAQEHHEGDSVDPANQTIRRKRGRPRKDDVSVSEPYRYRKRKRNAENYQSDPVVGQVVSGVLDGKFDAGYMLTVRIGERGSVLRGVVFEPGLSVPVSPTNDIAPNVKMLKRDEVSLPPTQQLPYFFPSLPTKDGALRCRQSNETSKEMFADTVAECADVKVEVLGDSTDTIQKVPESNNNHASVNLNQDLQPTIKDHASKDGTWFVKCTETGAECSGDPEIGNTSGIIPESAKAIHMKEEIYEDKPMAKQHGTVFTFKEPALLDGEANLTSDNLKDNLQEVVGDRKVDTKESEIPCDTKNATEASDAGLVSFDCNKTASLHDAGKPGNEECQIIAFVPNEVAEASDSVAVTKDIASDECDPVLPRATIPAAGQNIGLKEFNTVSDISEAKQPSEKSGPDTIVTNGASDDYIKGPPPEYITDATEDSRVDPQPVTQLSANESVPPQPAKHVSMDETARVANMNDCNGQESVTD